MPVGLHAFAAHLITLSALATTANALAVERSAPPLRPEQFRPVALAYKASKFFITAETSVALSSKPAPEVIPELTRIEGLQGIMPDQDRVIVERMHTGVLGRNTDTEVLMNPNTRSLQLYSLKSGHQDRYRLYRHFSDQVYSIKRFPKNNSEKAAGWTQWSDIIEDYYPTAEENRSLTITEAEGLFYLISVLDWSQIGPHHSVILFDADGLIELTLDVAGDTKIKTDYEETNSQGVTTRIKGEIPVKQIRIDGNRWIPTPTQVILIL